MGGAAARLAAEDLTDDDAQGVDVHRRRGCCVGVPRRRVRHHLPPPQRAALPVIGGHNQHLPLGRALGVRCSVCSCLCISGCTTKLACLLAQVYSGGPPGPPPVVAVQPVHCAMPGQQEARLECLSMQMQQRGAAPALRLGLQLQQGVVLHPHLGCSGRCLIPGDAHQPCRQAQAELAAAEPGQAHGWPALRCQHCRALHAARACASVLTLKGGSRGQPCRGAHTKLAQRAEVHTGRCSARSAAYQAAASLHRPPLPGRSLSALAGRLRPA